MQSIGSAFRALGARVWRPVAGAVSSASALPAKQAGLAAEGAVGGHAYSSLVGQQLYGGGRPAGAAGAAGRSLLPPIAQPAQTRGVFVDVRDNNVEGAMAKLKRKMISEGITKELKAQKVYIRPSKQRIIDNKERDKRVKKRYYKKLLKVILARRARGF